MLFPEINLPVVWGPDKEDYNDFELTNRAKPFSDRFCRKILTGNRSQRSRQLSDWLCLLETRLNRDLTS